MIQKGVELGIRTIRFAYGISNQYRLGVVIKHYKGCLGVFKNVETALSDLYRIYAV